MPTGHSYIFFLSGIHKDCDFSGHGTHFRSHRMQACSYSMRRLWIPAFLFCVPDAHSVSGYPVFSTDAVSVFSFRISFPAFPDTRIRSHLHDSLLHFLRSHLRFFFPALCSGVSYMPSITACEFVISCRSYSIPFWLLLDERVPLVWFWMGFQNLPGCTGNAETL